MKAKFGSFRPFVCLAAVAVGLSAFALPAGYTRVSCIEGTGGYALTDYVPRPAEDEIEFTFATREYMGANFVLFSSRPEDASVPDGFIGAFYYGYGDFRRMRFDYNRTEAQVTDIPSYRDETIYTLVLKDGVLAEKHGGVLASLPHEDFTPTNGVCIFAQRQGKDTANIGRFRFYRMKVTRNGEVIHDFVPVKNASGVGMIVDDVANPATVQMVTLNHPFGIGGAQQPLTLEVGEGGSVLLNGEPTSVGTYQLASASDAQLTAVPAAGYQFWRWEGDVEDEFRGSPEAKVSMLKGSTARALFLPAATAKPAFTPVDWIRGADLNFFFETDYVPNPTTDRIVAEMMFPAADTANHRGVWCARDVDGTNTKDGRYTFLYASNDGLSFQFGNTSSGIKSLVAVKNISASMRYQLTADQNVASVYTNGVLAGRYSYAANPSFTAAGGPLCILANYARPTDPIRVCAADARLYSFRIYRNGVLIHNLQPALDANGVATLVDTCAAEPMALVRHGSFTYGAVAKRVTVDALDGRIYTGEAVEPAVTVRDVETGESVDVAANFDVAYGDNVEPGWGRVILTAKAGSPYEGQVVDAPFSIAQVLHVTPEAAGGGNGGSWATAMTFAEAVAAIAEKGGEIWLKTGGVPMKGITTRTTFAKPVRILGGFVGTESSSEDRDATRTSTLDGVGQYGIIDFVTATFVDIERVVFTRVKGDYTIHKMGAGVLRMNQCTVTDCEWRGNRGYNASGSPANFFNGWDTSGISGVVLVTGGTAVFTDCDFSGNKLDTAESNNANGGAVGLSNVTSATFDRCTFFTNVVALTTGEAEGTAISFFATVLTCENCEFRGNRGLGKRASVIGMNGPKDTTFRTCVFVGNDMTGSTAGGNANPGRGLINPWASAFTSAKFLFENCTLAYNKLGNHFGVLAFTTGYATVTNCIFWANVRDAVTSSGNYGNDIFVDGQSGASHSFVTVGHSLFGGNTRDYCYHKQPIAAGSLTILDDCLFEDPKFRTSTTAFKTMFGITGELPVAASTWPGFEQVMKLDVHLRGSSRAFGLGAYKDDRPVGCMILVQ